MNTEKNGSFIWTSGIRSDELYQNNSYVRNTFLKYTADDYDNLSGN